MILLDTNVVIWLITRNALLGPLARATVREAVQANNAAVSMISFWELAMLRSKDRIPPEVDPARVHATFQAERVEFLPLTPEICIRAGFLEGLPGDPADRLIVATAMEGHRLVTRDRKILNWSGPLQTIPANR